jgi:hypothetical protein
MTHYSIATHLLQVSGSGLNHISGFQAFVSSKVNGSKPILQLQLGVPLNDWSIAPQHTSRLGDGDISYSFAANKDVYLFRMEKAVRPNFLMEIQNLNGRFTAITNMDENTSAYLLRFYSWIAFSLAALHHQTVAIHASTITYKGKSILFLGESGTGKSTHTRLWLDNIEGSELLNDDSPFIGVKGFEVGEVGEVGEAGEIIKVFGSPWSGKTPCYKNQETPVAAIVRLSQAPQNTIRPLKGIAALGALLPSCPPVFAYDKRLQGYISAILSAVLKQVPVYSLQCLPNPEAAHLVFSRLQQDGRL